MKKALSAVFALFVLCSPALARDYVNGIDANYPPFAYVDEKSGKPAGFDVEALDWIARDAGIVIRHEPVAWDGIVPALLAKKIDMICSGMSITPERAARVAFSAPYWKLANVFVVKKGSGLSVDAVLRSGGKVGGQRGTNEIAALIRERKEKKYPFEVRLYDSAPLMVEDILNGRLEAALMDSLPALDSIAKGRAVAVAGAWGSPVLFGVAFRKEDKALRELIDAGYAKLLADPFWKALQEKYGVYPLE
jgi:polar amino acid transport system substrate-binding protein